MGTMLTAMSEGDRPQSLHARGVDWHRINA